MKHERLSEQADNVVDMPPPLDCETAALLRGFLTPLLETCNSWNDLAEALKAKGYAISFRAGHLVLIKTETGEAVCTGRTLGVPLRQLSARLGRPAVKVHPGGQSGELA